MKSDIDRGIYTNDTSLPDYHALEIGLLRYMRRDRTSMHRYRVNQKVHLSRIYAANYNILNLEIEFMKKIIKGSWVVVNENNYIIELLNQKTGETYTMPKTYTDNYYLGNEKDERGNLVIHLFQDESKPDLWFIDQPFHPKKDKVTVDEAPTENNVSEDKPINSITWKDMAKSILTDSERWSKDDVCRLAQYCLDENEQEIWKMGVGVEIPSREDLWTEFKQSLSLDHAASVMGYLNVVDKGGKPFHLFMGVKDDGSICGIEQRTKSEEEKFETEFRNRFAQVSNSVSLMEKIKFDWLPVANRMICVLTVPPIETKDVLFYKGTECYKRIGAMNKHLQGQDLVDLIRERDSFCQTA